MVRTASVTFGRWIFCHQLYHSLDMSQEQKILTTSWEDPELIYRASPPVLDYLQSRKVALLLGGWTLALNSGIFEKWGVKKVSLVLGLLFFNLQVHAAGSLIIIATTATDYLIWSIWLLGVLSWGGGRHHRIVYRRSGHSREADILADPDPLIIPREYLVF